MQAIRFENMVGLNTKTTKKEQNLQYTRSYYKICVVCVFVSYDIIIIGVNKEEDHQTNITLFVTCVLILFVRKRSHQCGNV